MRCLVWLHFKSPIYQRLVIKITSYNYNWVNVITLVWPNVFELRGISDSKSDQVNLTFLTVYYFNLNQSTEVQSNSVKTNSKGLTKFDLVVITRICYDSVNSSNKWSFETDNYVRYITEYAKTEFVVNVRLNVI